jgi:hypothetical protein
MEESIYFQGDIDDQVHFRTRSHTQNRYLYRNKGAAVARGVTSLWKCNTIQTPAFIEINMQ